MTQISSLMSLASNFNPVALLPDLLIGVTVGNALSPRVCVLVRRKVSVLLRTFGLRLACRHKGLSDGRKHLVGQIAAVKHVDLEKKENMLFLAHVKSMHGHVVYEHTVKEEEWR